MSVAQVPTDSQALSPRRRKSGTYPMLVTRISTNHYTVTSSSLPLTAYDVTREVADAAWRCDCEARVQRCRHVVAVEEYEGYRAEPVAPPTAEEVARAAAPLRSGSVMEVLARRRQISQAVREDQPIPGAAPAPLCISCRTRPVDPLYAKTKTCGFCGLQAAF